MSEDGGALRSREHTMGAGNKHNGAPSTLLSRAAVSPNPNPSPNSTATTRSSPFLPTSLETILFAVYPVILVFGTLFSALSPETRAAPYDAVRQSHVQAQAPSYFARKDNLFNVLFVKRGWLWITVAFVAFVATHPVLSQNSRMATRAATRWALVTGWWVLVTQWCFGPPLIDRGFRITGGKCEVAMDAVEMGTADAKEFVTAAACRTAGGSWSGGHDISGHVFLLVLGSCFLAQEVIGVALRAGSRFLGRGDDRSIVMGDGAVKGAGVEAERAVAPHETHLAIGGRIALGTVGLSFWMLLMTAVYFHTWFEKLTGLLIAFVAVYAIYILPRWIPAIRALTGIPGI
ncbi:inositol phospholipid synthesis and fat-storage-inducing TM-domain-containing protein [Astrocystis sublimbata]|nr:inositol phospholipid synthesis and fat-storage-inducing TM-domain-containing protein [Astrocystis sublimbata]